MRNIILSGSFSLHVKFPVGAVKCFLTSEQSKLFVHLSDERVKLETSFLDLAQV